MLAVGGAAAANHHSVIRRANRVSSQGEPTTCEMLEKSCETREIKPEEGDGRALAAGAEVSVARRN